MELVCSKKLELNEAQCNNKELNLDYYLVVCETDNSCTYGIKIDMRKDSGEFETAVINDVFPSRSSTIELIKILNSNSVTPVSAHDIVYDYIA